MVFPSGEMIGAKTPFRLIHFSNETEAFFWAKKDNGIKSNVRMRKRFILIFEI
jgi:hypothetical protein